MKSRFYQVSSISLFFCLLFSASLFGHCEFYKNVNISQNAQGNVISWTTMLEINNEHFAIERSTDQKTYEELAQIEGAKNSKELNHYLFIDEKVVDGAYSYRIKTVDSKGKESYSKIITINRVSEGDEIEILSITNPNEVGNLLELTVSCSKETQLTYSLKDAGRSLVKIQTRDVAKGENNLSIDLSDIEAGLYQLSLFSSYDKDATIINKTGKPLGGEADVVSEIQFEKKSVKN